MARPKKDKKPCSFEGCERHQVARGLCNMHYARWLRYGDPSVKHPTGVQAGTKSPLHQECSIPGCNRLGPYIKGLCGAHYGRLKDHGDPLKGKPKVGVITYKTSSEKCSVSDCERKARAKGLCNAHWNRARSSGETKPDVPIRVGMPGVRTYLDPNGYVGRWDSNKKAIAWDHRTVMSEFLGRALRRNESVHHKNGIRADNRIENLELWVSSQPAGQRPQDLIKWAREIINKYEGEESKFKQLDYRNK